MSETGWVSIEARSLVRVYGDERAVDDVDLQVRRGEIHAIVGLNGAGKTTLMRMLMGMVKPTSGRALIDGQDVKSAGPELWRQVGCLIETPFAYPELTVRENLFAAALLHGLDQGEIEAEVGRVIDEFELVHWEHKRSRVLSLGNRQRLGLASSFVHRPSILVLDEPANALDPAGVVFIRDLLRASAKRGTAVLVSSHHLDELARVAHRITLLHRGRIIGALDPEGVDLERRFFDQVYRDDQESGVA
jgi:ABC-2 type transport system ATP-binding protein